MLLVATFLLFTAALPPLSVPIAGYLGLLPLLCHVTAPQRSMVRANLDGLLVGGAVGAYAFWGALSEGVPLYSMCIALCAAQFALFSTLSRGLLRRDRHPASSGHTIAAALALGACWAIAECLLNAAGLPFTLALTIVDQPGLRHLAALGGTPLISLALVAGQILIHSLSGALRARRRRQAAALGAALSAHSLLIALPAALLPTASLQAAQAWQSVVIAQTDLSADVVARPSTIAHLTRILHQHKTLRAAAGRWYAQHRRPYVLVWPESSLPMLSGSVMNDAMRSAADGAIADVHHVYRLDDERHVHSETRMHDRQGRLLSVSGKQLTVPFAEAAIAHDGSTALHVVDGTPFGALICYEAALDVLPRKLVSAGARWLLVSSNDAYQGASFLDHMTLGLLRLRAIETGAPIVRAANGGSSAVILPDGRIDASLKHFRTGILGTRLPLSTEATPFVRFGLDTHALPIVVGLVAAIGLRRCNRRDRPVRGCCHAVEPAVRRDTIGGVIRHQALPLLIVLTVAVAAQDHRVRARHGASLDNGPARASDQVDGSTTAVHEIVRHFGFAHPRTPFPDATDAPMAMDAIERWARTHGLKVAFGSLDDPPLRVRHAAPGLLLPMQHRPLARSLLTLPVVTGRQDGQVRLYLPRHDRYDTFPLARVQREVSSAVLWFLPEDAMPIPMRTAKSNQ